MINFPLEANLNNKQTTSCEVIYLFPLIRPTYVTSSQINYYVYLTKKYIRNSFITDKTKDATIISKSQKKHKVKSDKLVPTIKYILLRIKLNRTQL